MNLQTIAVIFAIIVIPISLVLSAYIGTHIDTLVYQSQYDTKLANATYDAVKAFQLNTLNNQYSTISDSKIRDIEASVNVFFDSLGTNLGWGSYNENQVKEHVPALVYTLYDGYYIYSKYDNIGNGTSNNVETGVALAPGETAKPLSQDNQYGLKPYIYYTCRYQGGTGTDFIVNYTLDNAVVVYGYIKGNYVTKSGYLYNGTVPGAATEEYLSETLLIFIDEDKTKWFTKEYDYVNVNGTKLYIDNTHNSRFRAFANGVDNNDEQHNTGKYFLYKDNKKVGIGTFVEETFNKEQDTSAVEYYDSANPDRFAEWWNSDNGPGGINGLQPVETNEDGTGIKPITDVAFPTKGKPLEVTDDTIEDINEHKRAVIQRSIKSNLYTAMANFSKQSTSSYEFRMPEIDETEWDKVVGSVGLIAFMQGIPMGNKYYNDYCIVSNNNNKEFVSEDSIYVVDKNQGTKGTYHRAGCMHWNESGIEWNKVEAYLNIDFRRQTVKGKIDENGDGVYEDKNYYYYPQEAQACYDCIVSQNGVKDTKTAVNSNTPLKTIFYRAYAREKYNLYKLNDYLNDT